jgi:hypothetical protein
MEAIIHSFLAIVNSQIEFTSVSDVAMLAAVHADASKKARVRG